MMRQFFTFISCAVILMSCSYFEQQYKKESIKKVDTIVDFTSVDAFPLFPNCKDIPSREKQQICFQLEMAQHIYGALKEHALNASEKVQDTVLVKLKVNSVGKTSLSNIQISDEQKKFYPEFDRF